MKSKYDWVDEWEKDRCNGLSISDFVHDIQQDAQPQWLPIESAPRDGTWIFVYWPTMSITEYPTIVFADDCSEHDIWYKPNDLDFGCVYPTHWQPLPAAPNPPSAGDRA